MTAAEAVRKWNPARTKANINVTFPDGSVSWIGGGRAHRARAVIAFKTIRGTYGAMGVRADVSKAENEARALVKERYGRPSPYAEGFVIPVTELCDGC